MCRCATSGLFSSLTFDLGWVTSFFLIFSPSSLTLLHEVVLGVCDDDCSISTLKCYKMFFLKFSFLRRWPSSTRFFGQFDLWPWLGDLFFLNFSLLRRWHSSTRLFWGYATTIVVFRLLSAIRCFFLNSLSFVAEPPPRGFFWGMRRRFWYFGS